MKQEILKIKRVPYSRLTKSEMADYAEKTIDVVDRYYNKDAPFNSLLDLLTEKEADIRLLRLNYGIDEHRLRLQERKQELNLTISAFKLKVKMAKKNKPKLDMHIVENPINKHLRLLDKCRNDSEYNQRIGGFFDLIDKDEAVETAISELGATSEANDMRSAFSYFNEIWNKRILKLSKRDYCNTELIVKGIKERISNLFDGIEASYLIGTLSEVDPDNTAEQVDYTALMDELNQLSVMVRKSIELRDLINKRKRNGEPIDDLLGDAPEQEEDSEPEAPQE